MSLLPRHRGPDPIFWTYWDDDRDAGVTIHWMNGRIDGGDIAAQEAVPLKRGMASRELYGQLTTRGVELLSGVLRQVAMGDSPRRPQDDAKATCRSAADVAQARIPFGLWPAERVWHVLSGLGDQFHHLLDGPTGGPIAHSRASHYRVTGEIEPGHVAVLDFGYELHCCDGIVTVDRQDRQPGDRAPV
jgi:methionyl-tRNA formyltransferase